MGKEFKRTNSGCDIVLLTMGIDEALAQADQVRQSLRKALDGEYSDDERTVFAVAYTDVSMETHEAIGALVRARLYGPAFALWRTIFEVLFKSHWVNKCATDKQIRKLRQTEKFDFPGVQSIVDAVDQAYGTSGFFGAIKKQGWGTMNGFTHSGVHQLSRRFKGSVVEPSYKESEVVEIITSSTAAIVQQGLFLANVGQKDDVKRAVGDILDKFAEE